MSPDLTLAIVGHREGRLAVASLRSFSAAAEAARTAGLSVETLYVLDTPDALTEDVFSAAAGGSVHKLEFSDQSATRNAAVQIATGRRLAFLDADDLWTADWPVRANAFLNEAGPGVIAHPAYNYFFGEQATIYRQIDQESPEFDADLLRIANYWDALCLADTEVYRRTPYQERDLDCGWAYEDWSWNCETVAAGLRHKIVPGTVLFKRRRRGSQTIRASAARARTRRNPLSSYAHPIYQP